jgi:hypothetical protein
MPEQPAERRRTEPATGRLLTEVGEAPPAPRPRVERAAGTSAGLAAAPPADEMIAVGVPGARTARLGGPASRAMLPVGPNENSTCAPFYATSSRTNWTTLPR